MPINMSCASCGKSLSAPDTAAGKKAKCPVCGTVMIVPLGVFDAEEIGLVSLAPSPTEYGRMDDTPGAAPSQWPAGSVATQPLGRRPCPTRAEQIVATAAKCRFCGSVFDARRLGPSANGGQFNGNFAAPRGPRHARVRQIHRYFMVWWISTAVGTALCITYVGAPLGLPIIIAGVVFRCMLLYALWSEVQDGRAATTPGRAVGFMFIPLFNIY